MCMNLTSVTTLQVAKAFFTDTVGLITVMCTMNHAKKGHCTMKISSKVSLLSKIITHISLHTIPAEHNVCAHSCVHPGERPQALPGHPGGYSGGAVRSAGAYSLDDHCGVRGPGKRTHTGGTVVHPLCACVCAATLVSINVAPALHMCVSVFAAPLQMVLYWHSDTSLSHG